MKYGSKYNKEELTARWDDLTSPARFAGAHEQNDWIFNAGRKEDKIKLVKKPKAAYDPYAAVFRGKITDKGIVGTFTKGVFDYIITAAIAAVYFGVCAKFAERADNKILPLIFIFVGVIAVFAVLKVYPHTKKVYGELIRKVTGEEPSEPEENKPEENKEKYKFKFSGK